MKKNKTFPVGVIFLSFAVLIPIAYIIYCAINSYVVSEILVALFTAPFALSAVIVMIRKMPRVLKVVLPVLILVVSFLVTGWLAVLGGHREFRAFDNKKEIVAYYGNFDFDGFGNYENISHYMYHSTGFFQQRSYTTILKYDEESFAEEKKNIEENYDFYSEPVKEDDPVPVFTCDGFAFRLEKRDVRYPHEMFLVGTNDETCEIAYVAFEDRDLDGVSDFGNFLESYSGWQLIAKERK